MPPHSRGSEATSGALRSRWVRHGSWAKSDASFANYKAILRR